MAILFVFQSFDRHDFVSSLKKKKNEKKYTIKKKERKKSPRQAGREHGAELPAVGSSSRTLFALSPTPHPGTSFVPSSEGSGWAPRRRASSCPAGPGSLLGALHRVWRRAGPMAYVA